MQRPDICIAGAGIIGLSLALELHRRGARVTVLERDRALAHASTAAAGMLAAEDPENPAALHSLAALSVRLYPAFLSRIEELSGLPVPFETSRTLQAHPSYTTSDHAALPQLVPGEQRFRLLHEHSLDPRRLAASLYAAIAKTPIQLLEQTALLTATETGDGVRLETSAGALDAGQLVHTQGAWSLAPVSPRKGQMLTVALPSVQTLREVIRTPEIYIVPRTTGPNAGLALIGATVEQAGFDTTTHAADLAGLRALASRLLPVLSEEQLCRTVDQWAGLRPATPDALPLLGRLPSSRYQLIAAGHYRNGILLAPATAEVAANLLEGKPTPVDLSAFAPGRFLRQEDTAQQHRYSPTCP